MKLRTIKYKAAHNITRRPIGNKCKGEPELGCIVCMAHHIKNETGSFPTFDEAFAATQMHNAIEQRRLINSIENQMNATGTIGKKQ